MTVERNIGPVQAHLLKGAELWPDVIRCIAHLGTSRAARLLIYESDMYLRRTWGQPHLMARGMSEIVGSGDLPDVLTEAICASEGLGL